MMSELTNKRLAELAESQAILHAMDIEYETRKKARKKQEKLFKKSIINRRSYAKHKTRYNAEFRQKRIDNPHLRELDNQRNRKFYAANKEEILKQRHNQYIKRVTASKNNTGKKANNLRWRLKNPDYMRTYAAKRRAAKLAQCQT